MKKNIFDRMSDSYERFHLKESEIRMGNDSISVSPKLKLVLGWSVFLLCAVLAYVFVGFPFLNVGGATKVDKKDVLSQKVDTKNEHDTIVPYEKDADKELNAFIGDYFKAITSCDNEKLQDMVTDSSEYSNNESLKKKAEFITGYDNITVYTKEGLEEGSYVAFVVSNLTIAGVNSSPYDISTLYIVTGSQGFRIQNGTLPDEISKYIEKVKGDKDIQKIYKSIEKKNEALKEKDSSLQQFYEIISRRNVETNSVADQTSEQTDDATTAAESSEPASTEAETTEAPATEAPATETPATEAPATEAAQ
ncbi:MAG: hypothetical protein MR029_10580 [Clostridium sp.]|nr:hypothetical protein [Clostridium sp.]